MHKLALNVNWQKRSCLTWCPLYRLNLMIKQHLLKNNKKTNKPFESISQSRPLATSAIIKETNDEVLRENILNDVSDHSLQTRQIEWEHNATRTQRDKDQQE